MTCSTCTSPCSASRCQQTSEQNNDVEQREQSEVGVYQAPVLLEIPESVTLMSEINDENRILSDYEIFNTMKRLASFIGRQPENTLYMPGYDFEGTIRMLARNLATKLKRQREMQDIHPSVYSTLSKICEEGCTEHNAPPDPKLCQCLTKYLRFYLHDHQESAAGHKCTRRECAKYCILPIFARICFPRREVDFKFQRLKTMIQNNPSLISTSQRTNEAQTAINLLKYKTILRYPSLSYDDTLYAMAGHHGTIFNPESKVDSRLYKCLFNLFRSYDYSRLEEMYDDIDPEIFKTPSVSLLDIESSQILKNHIDQIETSRSTLGLPELTVLSSESGPSSIDIRSSIPSHPRNVGSSPRRSPSRTRNSDTSNTDPYAPPSYHSLQHPNTVIPSAPAETTMDDVPPSYTSLHNDTNIVMPSERPASTSPSAPPEDELPSYEQTQDVALLPRNRPMTPSAPSASNSPSAPLEEFDNDDGLPTYEEAMERNEES